ncbi:MAG: hypothetical protein C0483_17845 [Pirellula sp.]|nr:hypothetical protein [Pirellula sp.]
MIDFRQDNPLRFARFDRPVMNEIYSTADLANYVVIALERKIYFDDITGANCSGFPHSRQAAAYEFERECD